MFSLLKVSPNSTVMQVI